MRDFAVLHQTVETVVDALRVTNVLSLALADIRAFALKPPR